jgi:hypothetical protein
MHQGIRGPGSTLESHDKGPSKKKQDDREVNMTDRGDREDHGYRGKQSSD